MDNKKSVSGSSSSSSSSLDHIFGPRVSSSSSSSTTGLFQSIFPLPSTVMQANSASRNEAAKYQTTNFGIPNERGERSKNKERKSYQSEETQPPCNLSSSIYYGGQDNYSSSTTNPDAYKKDGEEGDSESASRGNWWEGSFNY
ncbi:hypothetical protein ARALYDRAFT_321676 [Arabidopsis lyrata subsp. lyrata]|uniref:Uncharacterized protein n=2 Tax=Arabidopsis lyrata subsp. lyrata TaxID=81972 RepID=D7LDT5_ARALL|nr:hypothetical protein ARALYDRAFT_321676 [Arabidopsis lyrata subsp. lyrata]